MLEVGEFQAQLPYSKGDPPAEEATGDKGSSLIMMGNVSQDSVPPPVDWDL